MQRLKENILRDQAAFDQEISGWIKGYTSRGGRIYCGKGCKHCCNLAVNATLPEALCIADVLTGQQAPRINDHVRRLLTHRHRFTDLKTYLSLHRREIGFCPLLNEDGSCGVYAVRPFSCRSLLSTREDRWCATDFAALTSEEKSAFVESLDLTAVSFPMHYVAATQNMGQELESQSDRRMARQYGFSLYGNLTVLIFLELEHRLGEVVCKGWEATEQLLEQAGVNSPYLVSCAVEPSF